MAIIIEDRWLNHIKKITTFPFSTKELLLTDEQIKEYCIFPVLDKYFNKFPITVPQQINISTSTDFPIPFPDDNTYGVVDARIVGKGMLLGTGGSFWDLITLNSMMGKTRNGYGMYGKPGYNPNGLKQQYLNQRYETASLSNLMTTTIRVDDVARYLYVACSGSGKLDVVWAKKSENFANIKHVYIWDVIDLCQAEYLLRICDSAGMINNTMLEIQLNIEALRNRANELINKIEEKWKLISDIVVIRST